MRLQTRTGSRGARTTDRQRGDAQGEGEMRILIMYFYVILGPFIEPAKILNP